MAAPSLPAQAKDLFHYLFEQASLGIAVEDIEGTILLVNPALCSMLGYAQSEFCGKNCSYFAKAEDSKGEWDLFEQLSAGRIGHYSLEKCYLTKSGAPLWARVNVPLEK